MTTVFETLTTLYPTSEALFDHLRSPIGGSHMIIEEDGGNRALIYYSKNASNTRGEFRSVVWNKTTNKPLSVSPAYGHRFSAAIDSALAPGSFSVEEYIDGTMVNQYYDGTAWRVSTRTRLDADNSFYGKRTFAELFQEAFAAVGLKTDMLNPGMSYSWVLQHPEERNVVAPAYGIPSIYLVHTYGGSRMIDVAPTTIYPKQIALRTLEEVKDYVAAEGRRRGHQFKGVCLKTPQGVRYKLRSTEFEAACALRGNQAKRAYTWLERWTEKKLTAYLRIYPEEQCDADAVIEKFKQITQDAYDLYQQVYRTRTLRLGDSPQKYRKLLWDAHQAGKGAYFPHMRDFVNGQETRRKLWLVNYESRYAANSAEMPTPTPTTITEFATPTPTVST